MALNISIDVDGTLLDANENLVLRARESLQQLKTAGHRLQLWSTGGAEYAHKKAVEHQLTDLFESYATKPDVAIDDLPEAAHPLAVIGIDDGHGLASATKRILNIEETVEAALTPSQALIDFVEQIQIEEDALHENYEAILRPNIPLHPIPFFGVIEHARAITVGLNPSSTEFTDTGRWPTVLAADELTRRLVGYFRSPRIAPHYWFAELQWALELLHCPYHLTSAHIDVSPWPTYGPRHLANNHPDLLPLYNQLLNAGLQNCLPRTLRFCRNTVRLVVICSSEQPGPAEYALLQAMKQTIANSLGEAWTGKIEIKPKCQVPRWAWENKKELISLLGLGDVFS